MKRIRRLRPVARLGLLLLFSLFILRPVAAWAQSSVELLEDFALEEVTVDDPHYQQLFEVDIDYVLRLDPVRLMAGFRAVAMDQDPATAPGLYGGWEDGWSLLRGHTMGHYLTALARAYKQTLLTDPTKAEEIKAVIDSTVAQLREYQIANGNGFLFASHESHFDVVEGRVEGDQWVPWYTLHKIIAGMTDVYKLTGNTVALDVASALGDWTYNRASQWDSAMRTRVLGIEYGGMNDCLYELYKHTTNANHLEAAHIFDEETLFTPISEGNDVLNGKHANTQIPKIIGSLNRFRTLGSAESHYFDVAEEFWTLVVNNHTYVTGGNSQLEHFHEPGALDANRDNTNNETCNSYNMMKLTRELFKVTPDVKYADFYERAFINEILSAIHPETGMTTYFKPMGTGYFKAFGREETFWCCNGSGMENYTKLSDGIYYHDEDELYVNMYVSSTLNWADRGLELRQSADVPLSPTVTLTIDAAPTDAVTIKFRRPWWLGLDQLPRITINGQPLCIDSSAGYFDVARVWTAGDVVELTLPADVRVSRLPDNPNAVAFTYGPVVLSAGMGTEQMITEPQWASEKAMIPEGVTIKDTISIQDGSIEDWIANVAQNLIQTPGTLDFSLRGTDEDANLIFSPQYLRHSERYGIYFVLQGEQGEAPAPVPVPEDGPTDCEGATGGTGGQGNTTGTSNSTGTTGDAAAGIGGTMNSSGGDVGSVGTTAAAGPTSVGTTASAGGNAGALETTAATGGVIGAGGTSVTGDGTVGGSAPVPEADDSAAGCGCSVPGRQRLPFPLLLSGLFGLLLITRRRCGNDNIVI
ncbi:MAG TPA: beta-L-arabinofuranosidase domain-containing protein [Polyangiaceae bacterium]